MDWAAELVDSSEMRRFAGDRCEFVGFRSFVGDWGFEGGWFGAFCVVTGLSFRGRVSSAVVLWLSGEELLFVPFAVTFGEVCLLCALLE